MSEEFNDLDDFNEEFSPEGAIRPDFGTLADGDYDFEIIDAELTRAANGDRIVALGLKVSSGAIVQRTYWLNRQMNVNAFGADMRILGFNSETWGSAGKPLSEAMPECVTQLPGMKFRGSKRMRKGKEGKEYPELYITSRIGGTVMPASAEAF